MTLVVHPHFHRRRTGVTRHVESLVTELSKQVDARVLGVGLQSSVPKIRWTELLKRRSERGAIWHAHRNLELLVGLLLKRAWPGLKVFYTRHSSRSASWYTRFLSARADLRISLTSQAAAVFGMKSTIVPHGIDLNCFVPPADRFQSFQSLNLGGRYGMGVVGRIRPEKGQGDFVEAVRPLLSHHPLWRAALVGLAKGRDSVWAQKLRTNAKDQIFIAGEQQNVRPWYQGFSILVHPSHREAYSMVLLEAMASGCCVVATRLPHHPDVIEHGRTGFLYPTGDIIALRNVLSELMQNPTQAERIGLQAAEEARARFGVQVETQKLVELYVKR